MHLLRPVQALRVHATGARARRAQRRQELLLFLRDPGYLRERNDHSFGGQAGQRPRRLRRPVQGLDPSPLGAQAHRQGATASYGLIVGRSRTSLTKERGCCVTSISTTWATSSGCSMWGELRPARGERLVSVDPGQITETRTLWPRNSSAME